MERRLKLLEKLKSTKLNKLTVKQGGIDVKLNLRSDLADANVSIEDKVLDMLEKYVGGEGAKKPDRPIDDVEESNDKTQSQSNDQSPLKQSERRDESAKDQNNESEEKKSKPVLVTSLEFASPTPAKRVRFDVNNANPESTLVDDKDPKAQKPAPNDRVKKYFC